MSLELCNGQDSLGQFASNKGYSELIAASAGDDVLSAFFERASAEGPLVDEIADKLDKLADPTAKGLAVLMRGQELVYITNGTHDGPDDEVGKYSDDEQRDKDGKWSGGDTQVKHATPGEVAAFQKEVAQGDYKGRAGLAQGVILMMTPKSPRAVHLVARGADGTFLGALQGMRDGEGMFHVTELAASPRVLSGEVKADHVGTHLMVEAAREAVRTAPGKPLHLTSMDAESTKFYKALGMKASSRGMEWSAAQVRAVAEHGVSKDDDGFDAGAALAAAMAVEEGEGAPMAAAGRTDFEIKGDIIKLDGDRHLVFGWFSVVQVDGKNITDTQGDIISPETIEESAYDFVLNARVGGEMHEQGKGGEVRGIGRLVESVVFTKEKQAAMVSSLKDQGITAVIDLGCVAWWGGFRVDSDATWKKVTTGELRAFSIGGRGKRAAL